MRRTLCHTQRCTCLKNLSSNNRHNWKLVLAKPSILSVTYECMHPVFNKSPLAIHLADVIPHRKSPVRRSLDLATSHQKPSTSRDRGLDLASSLRPRDKAPKPSTPIRLTDISSVQHDEDYDVDPMDGKF